MISSAIENRPDGTVRPNQRLRGLQVKHELELYGLDHRHIGGPFTFRNPSRVDADLPITISEICSVTHQTTCRHKLTEAQLRFAVCKREGLTSSHAARLAGYSGGPEAIRQNGSRANKSTAVQELLAYAHAETGAGNDGLVTGKEAKRILSRIARTGDNTARIKALESLARMDRDEQAASAAKQLSHDEADSFQALVESCGLEAAKMIDHFMKQHVDRSKTKSISLDDYRKSESNGPEQPDAA